MLIIASISLFHFIHPSHFILTQNEHDLSLHTGEIIDILEKNEHGWWLGIVQRNGSVYRGYFPRNYVKERVRAAPAPPPRPTDMKRGDSEAAEAAAAVQKVSIRDTAPVAGSRVSSIRRAAHSVRSLTAFDDLTDKGYAVEIAERAGAPAITSGTKAVSGDRVELQVVGLIWDGASTDTREFGRGVLRFTLGQRSVPSGLELAVQQLFVGQSASVTCAASQAYGAAGNPPLVPPNSFVVFHTVFLSCTPAASLPAGSVTMAPEGPAEFFTSGVASAREVKAGAPQRRDSSRIVLQSAQSAATEEDATR